MQRSAHRSCWPRASAMTDMDSLSIVGKLVDSRPYADVRSGLRASVEQGQVAWGTFSGPRSRGTGFGSQALRHQHRLFVRWSRPPRMVPAPVPQATCPGTRVACYGVARHPQMNQGGGGAPGRRPDSRLPPMLAGHGAVDAAARRRPRRPPASVGRRTGAPPPPWRHDVGMPAVRGQTTFAPTKSDSSEREFV